MFFDLSDVNIPRSYSLPGGHGEGEESPTVRAPGVYAAIYQRQTTNRHYAKCPICLGSFNYFFNDCPLNALPMDLTVDFQSPCFVYELGYNKFKGGLRAIF